MQYLLRARVFRFKLFLELQLVASVDIGAISPFVAHEEARHYLLEDLPNELFRQVLGRFLAFPDNLLQITIFTKLHHYVDPKLLLIYRSVIVLHYIRVFKLAQNVHLRYNLLLLLLIHSPIVEFLPDHYTAVNFAPYFRDFTKGSYNKRHVRCYEIETFCAYLCLSPQHVHIIPFLYHFNCVITK